MVNAEKVIVRFLKMSRDPSSAVFNPGDVAGFTPAVAAKLVRSGEAELADVGKGPGVLNRALGGFEAQRAIESDADYANRVPAEFRDPVRGEAPKKGIRGMIGA